MTMPGSSTAAFCLYNLHAAPMAAGAGASGLVLTLSAVVMALMLAMM